MLDTHILEKHASTRKADRAHVSTLFRARADLQRITDAHGFVLPDVWPDNIPPIAGLETIDK